jgi:hypothetical protein
LRANGAIEGGASGFAIDDEVLVLKKFDSKKVYVVGHVDGIKSCGWRFKLTRGDGLLITPDPSLQIQIYFFNSESALSGSVRCEGGVAYNYAGDACPITEIYDSASQQWKIPVQSSIDPNGYYVRYSVTDGVSTQYPYRYKSEDMGNPLDLIKPGTYTDAIPYLKVGPRIYTPTGVPGPLWPWTGGTGNVPVTCEFVVYSSVPYQVKSLGFNFDVRLANSHNVGGIVIGVTIATAVEGDRCGYTFAYSDGATQDTEDVRIDIGRALGEDFLIPMVLSQSHDLTPSSANVAGNTHSVVVGPAVGTILSTGSLIIDPPGGIEGDEYELTAWTENMIGRIIGLPDPVSYSILVL